MNSRGAATCFREDVAGRTKHRPRSAPRAPTTRPGPKEPPRGRWAPFRRPGVRFESLFESLPVNTKQWSCKEWFQKRCRISSVHSMTGVRHFRLVPLLCWKLAGFKRDTCGKATILGVPPKRRHPQLSTAGPDRVVEKAFPELLSIPERSYTHSPISFSHGTMDFVFHHSSMGGCPCALSSKPQAAAAREPHRNAWRPEDPVPVDPQISGRCLREKINKEFRGFCLPASG